MNEYMTAVFLDTNRFKGGFSLISFYFIIISILTIIDQNLIRMSVDSSKSFSIHTGRVEFCYSTLKKVFINSIYSC